MDTIKESFSSSGIKATPQRMMIYKALQDLGHATVDEVAGIVRSQIPTISVATIYKTLETLAENRLIDKLYTNENRLYYDITPTPHHHLSSPDNPGRIVDYTDPQLREVIMNHLSGKTFQGFELEDVKIQIIGKFI